MSISEFIDRIHTIQNPTTKQKLQFMEELKYFYNESDPLYLYYVGLLKLDTEVAEKQKQEVLSKMKRMEGVYSVG
jgi:hypothetical protein